MSRPGIAAIVLAGGRSSRLGEPKQLIRVAGETLLDHAIRVASEAGCEPVIVVLGAAAEQVASATRFGQALVVRNDLWQEGIASSIRAGVAGVPAHAAGAVLMVCDQPAVPATHLEKLMEMPERATASRYAGQNGVPAYFPASDFARLGALHGDTGARGLLRDAPAIELPGGEIDIDTPDDLRRMHELFS